jgi:16S rRNA C967 or C1407 C5-methylase (RsmB/RsmF family)/NOL1/NOP2/fmu family ribosome biogenesis protein
MFLCYVQLPDKLLVSLKNIPGFDETSFKAVHASGDQVTSVRINPKKIQQADIEILAPGFNSALTQIPWCAYGYYINERPSFTLDPLIHAGAYYVQEASSMFLWHILESVVNRQDHSVVLDLCAAPGGKSTLLSSFFANGLVVSNEVIKSRVNILQENITKWGNENVIVTNNDSKDFTRLDSFFNVIVADVPCSGSGLFRKDPSAIDEWSVDNVNLCCQRQQRILADIIPSLKENGILIYSTCSYSKEEDEEILDWIVDEFHLQPLQVSVPAEWNIIESASLKNNAFGYRFFPDKVKGEGFFIAAFKQLNEVKESRKKEANLSLATAKEIELLKEYIQIPEVISVFKHADIFNLFPSAFLAALKILSNNLYIKLAGVSAGSFKGKSFVPEHSLALSNFPLSFTKVYLDKAQALSYLRKQEIKITAPAGWCLVTYNNIGLGWIKNLSNRINNYYPSEWRILKS